MEVVWTTFYIKHDILLFLLIAKSGMGAKNEADKDIAITTQIHKNILTLYANPFEPFGCSQSFTFHLLNASRALRDFNIFINLLKIGQVHQKPEEAVHL